MTIKSKRVLTPEEREELRNDIAGDIARYLADGGKITQCPPRAFTHAVLDDEGKYNNKHTATSFSLAEPITDPIKRLIGGYIPRFANSKYEN